MENEIKKPKGTDKMSSKESKKVAQLDLRIINLKKELIKAIEEVNKSKESASKIINEYNERMSFMEERSKIESKYKSKDLFINLIKYIDTFEMALFSKKDITPEFKNWLIGFEMVYEGLVASLKSEGMSVIEPKIGEEFNAKDHNAIEIKEDNSKKENTILEIKQKGYMLHDRIIRPATVVITKKETEKIKDKKNKEEINKKEKQEGKG